MLLHLITRCGCEDCITDCEMSMRKAKSALAKTCRVYKRSSGNLQQSCAEGFQVGYSIGCMHWCATATSPKAWSLDAAPIKDALAAACDVKTAPKTELSACVFGYLKSVDKVFKFARASLLLLDTPAALPGTAQAKAKAKKEAKARAAAIADGKPAEVKWADAKKKHKKKPQALPPSMQEAVKKREQKRRKQTEAKWLECDLLTSGAR